MKPRLLRPWLFVTLIACAVAAGPPAADTVWLSALDLAPIRQSWGRAQADKSVTGKPLTIAGRSFERGVGTHADSTIRLELGGGCASFAAWVGVDDAAGNAAASVTFKAVADGRVVWKSDVMRHGQPARRVELSLVGVRSLLLVSGSAGDGVSFDHADWAEAQFAVTGARPVIISLPEEKPYLLTPKAGPAPRINAPRVAGCRPGHPFIFRIPTTGERPMRFVARGLPAGLTLDAERGLLTGAIAAPGTHVVALEAANAAGTGRGTLRIVCGDRLALTPTMGWNHWYAHYDRVTDALMREAADVMVRSGMADVGYQYVSIDDCWMNAAKHSDPRRVGPLRDAEGRILPNRYFPDMPALTAYIHQHGLRAGIYTSPGPRTCGGFAGAWQHEAIDARTFAEWGFDLLKYDWCSYGEIADKDPDPWPVKHRKPYLLMGQLLRQQPRDIVLNLCQYGMGEVWEWGAEVGGQSWRTAGDLGFELDRVFEVALKNAEHRAWSKPGAWNDPDYIQIGYVGDARGMGEPKPCPLTPSEQYAYISLWSLMASPLFYSGDMGRLDEFTLNVLCNPEVIEINQDPLGQCARVIPTVGEDTFVMVKDLEDGTRAVGLFNPGEIEMSVTARWSDLGLPASPFVRDVWRQRDLGRVPEAFKATVPRRGGVLLKVGVAP